MDTDINHICRGEIYRVNLEGAKGHEIYGGYDRPVLVLSINFLNDNTSVVAVVPGTSVKDTNKAKLRRYRNVVIVEPSKNSGLTTATAFLCSQIRALDHIRFPKNAAGRLAQLDMTRLEVAVAFSLGLEKPTIRADKSS